MLLLKHIVFSLALLSVSATVAAQPKAQPDGGYPQFVVAEDVVTQYVRGELRFCQRQNLKGRICGTYTKLFGKRIFEVGNWWSALTFAQAYTGLSNIEVTQVAPGPDGSSIVIYFHQDSAPAGP